jgi:hypothetical protein
MRNDLRIACGIGAIATLTMFVSSDEPVIALLKGTAVEPVLTMIGVKNSIVFNLSVGVLSSLLVWWLVSYRPDVARQRLIKSNLKIQHEFFVNEVIYIFRQALRPTEIRSPQSPSEFREFFSRESDALENGLQSSKELFAKLRFAIDLYVQGIQFALERLDATEPMLKLRSELLRVRWLDGSPEAQSDPEKYYVEFLIEALGNWDSVRGVSDGLDSHIKSL